MTPMASLRERRRAERIPYSEKIDVTWAAGTFQAYSADLSEAGIFIETTILLPVDTSVRVQFKVSSADRRHSVRAAGRVARQVSTAAAAGRGLPPGLGIEFEEVPDGEKALSHFIGERLRVMLSATLGHSKNEG